MVQGEDGECVRVLVEEGRGGRLVNEIILAEEKKPLRYTVYPWQHVTMATSITLMYRSTYTYMYVRQITNKLCNRYKTAGMGVCICGRKCNTIIPQPGAFLWGEYCSHGNCIHGDINHTDTLY